MATVAPLVKDGVRWLRRYHQRTCDYGRLACEIEKCMDHYNVSRSGGSNEANRHSSRRRHIEDQIALKSTNTPHPDTGESASKPFRACR